MSAHIPAGRSKNDGRCEVPLSPVQQSKRTRPVPNSQYHARTRSQYRQIDWDGTRTHHILGCNQGGCLRGAFQSIVAVDADAGVYKQPNNPHHLRDWRAVYTCETWLNNLEPVGRRALTKQNKTKPKKKKQKSQPKVITGIQDPPATQLYVYSRCRLGPYLNVIQCVCGREEVRAKRLLCPSPGLCPDISRFKNQWAEMESTIHLYSRIRHSLLRNVNKLHMEKKRKSLFTYVATGKLTKNSCDFTRNPEFCSTRSTVSKSGKRSFFVTRPIPAPPSLEYTQPNKDRWTEQYTVSQNNGDLEYELKTKEFTISSSYL